MLQKRYTFLKKSQCFFFKKDCLFLKKIYPEIAHEIDTEKRSGHCLCKNKHLISIHVMNIGEETPAIY